MLTLLFWNMNRLRREGLCARLAGEHAASVLVLAECERPHLVLQALNPPGRAGGFFPVPTPPDCRLRLFSRYLPDELSLVVGTRHHVIYRVSRTGADDLLLVAVHLGSKLRQTEAEQNGELRALAGVVAGAEQEAGHARTLLVGDLNADPFQEGVYAADGLHAVSSRDLALGGSRVVKGTEYPFFYNRLGGSWAMPATPRRAATTGGGRREPASFGTPSIRSCYGLPCCPTSTTRTSGC